MKPAALLLTLAIPLVSHAEPDARTLEVVVLDEAGKPLEGANVLASIWEMPDGVDFPNTDYTTDAEGVARVSAPKRLKILRLWAGKEGYAKKFLNFAEGVHDEGLLIRDRIEFHLPLATRLHGRIVNEAGQPIADAKVAVSLNASEPEWGPDAEPILGKWLSYSGVRTDETGRWQVTNAPCPPTQGGDHRFSLKVSHEDYVSDAQWGTLQDAWGITTQQLRDGSATITMQRGFAVQGRVVDSSNQPVIGAKVALATPSVAANLESGEPVYGTPAVETDEHGAFQFPRTADPIRVVVSHPEAGFGHVNRGPEDSELHVVLQSWASLEGTLWQDREPVADQRINFYRIKANDPGAPKVYDSWPAKSDAQGRFRFDRLPPTIGSVGTRLGPWEESPLTASQFLPISLNPRQEHSVSLGKEGAVVTGTVAETGIEEQSIDKNWSLNYLIHRDGGLPLPSDFATLSFDPSEPVEPSWALDGNFYAWLKTKPHYFVKLAPNGSFRVCGVPPGKYDLLIRLYEEPAGCLVETIGAKVVPIEVTEVEAQSGTVDAGLIEVPCRAGPRSGSDMRAFQYTDASGRRRSVFEDDGRYVLVHVWASWCAPCLQAMPDVKATAEQIADQPLTLVGLNVDAHPAAGRAAAERLDLGWSQSYLGDNSPLARQLALSSVPTYYLIGPDGRLVGSAIQWSEIKTRLHETLAH
ncbi:MAG: thioredoxin-like domain-containing protein [Planctomycetota bacterium]